MHASPHSTTISTFIPEHTGPARTPDSESLCRLHRLGILSDRDLAAAWDIEMACRDLGGQACSPTTQARCAAASRRFQIWVATLSDIGLPAGPVLDVVLDSRSLAEIDRRWRRRKGWARKVIAMALAEYPDVFAPAWSMARPAQNCAPAPLRHAFCLQEAV